MRIKKGNIQVKSESQEINFNREIASEHQTRLEYEAPAVHVQSLSTIVLGGFSGVEDSGQGDESAG